MSGKCEVLGLMPCSPSICGSESPPACRPGAWEAGLVSGLDLLGSPEQGWEGRRAFTPSFVIPEAHSYLGMKDELLRDRVWQVIGFHLV